MLFILPIIVSFLASILTFFSGFWIWTILLPVFAVFFPLNLAIAMTWIVHLLNNLFKFFLIWKAFNKNIVLKLWITWIIWSIIWAYLFLQLSKLNISIDFNFFWEIFKTNIFNIVIWVLLIIFSILEISPRFAKIKFSSIWIYIVWFLSGLFGWLSGHQWALRTAVLLKMNLDKNVFIATWVVIALMVDLTRMSIYFSNMDLFVSSNILLIICTTLSAFLWAFIWKKLLTKVTINFVKTIVSFMLIIMWILMVLGII